MKKDARISQSKAYLEGKLASEQNKDFNSPYKYGTKANAEWCRGYLE